MASTPGLQRKLQQTLGAEAAGDLVTWMQSMDANRMDVAELRRDMGDVRREVVDVRREIGEVRRDMEFGFARIDGRFDTMQERFEKLVEKALRDQTRFFFLAWSVLLAAIVGLYSR